MLEKESWPDKLYLGYEPLSWNRTLDDRHLTRDQISNLLNAALDAKADYVILPADISEVRCRHRFSKQEGLHEPHIVSLRAWVEKEYADVGGSVASFAPSTGSDLQISSNLRSKMLSLSGAAYTSLMDDELLSVDAGKFCEKMLARQIEWASHCTIYSFILPAPVCTTRRGGALAWSCARYGALLARIVSGFLTTRLWIRIPLVARVVSSPSASPEFLDGWHAWNQIRSITGRSLLEVVLELTEDVPLNETTLERWFAEPIRAIVIPPAIWRLTPSGTFALPKAEEFNRPCLDDLQTPLQPLRDNLESFTYETFEMDPVKYKQYHAAVFACLQDRIAAGRIRHVITVVGAGRGPLVEAVLVALRDSNVPKDAYKVTAVEKNPNAVITLLSRVAEDPNRAWEDVEVAATDMRNYNPKEKSDILVSELLGSFGDNELSPECLDGTQIRHTVRTGKRAASASSLDMLSIWDISGELL